ncbi:MFS transporter [Streptomyces sp. NPDC015032]|uniref:MFS transporter n=1 Tax=Streptomyces sp. NPDC015032 TaxID=3364937 RepID=UPI0036FD1962
MTPAIPSPEHGSVANRLERLPFCGWHRTLCALLVGAFMFEFIDLYTFAFSAPALVVHLGFTVPDIGTITAAAGIGAFVGAFVGGWAAGRIGRKPTLVACLVMFSVPSLLNALVSTPEWFIVLRFFTGIGYQGTTVVGGILLSELVPGHVRGRAFAWVNAIGGLGPALLAWLAFAVVPQFTWGWRVLYLVGGLGLLLVVPFLRRLPESPRWLESRGATDRARATTAQIEAAVRTEGHIIPEGIVTAHTEPYEGTTTGQPNGLGALFRQGFGRQFAVTCALWTLGVVGYFGFTAWLSTLLKLKGYTISEGAFITAVITTVGMIGLLASTVVTDRWQRRYSLAVISTVLGVTALLFTTSDSTVIVLGLGCVLQVLYQMTVPLTQAYSAEVFPTRFRAIGSGWASSSGRLGSILGTFAITAILGALGISAVFYFIAVVMLVLALTMAVFGQSTTGSLEENTEQSPANSPDSTSSLTDVA